jgi:hypothetical protein
MGDKIIHITLRSFHGKFSLHLFKIAKKRSIKQASQVKISSQLIFFIRSLNFTLSSQRQLDLRLVHSTGDIFGLKPTLVAATPWTAQRYVFNPTLFIMAVIKVGQESPISAFGDINAVH